MRRHARALYHSRTRLDNRILDLRLKPVSDWPEHTRVAYELLHQRLKIPASTARDILIQSTSVAHVCAQKINRRSIAIVQEQARVKLTKAFKRIANCAARGSV